MEFRFKLIADRKSKELMNRGSELVNNDIQSVFEKGLLEIVRYAMMGAPVDTGRLRADIGHKFNKRELKGIIYNDVKYAVHVHEGTRYMRGRPYIYNAVYDKGAVRLKRELDRKVLKEHRGL